MAKQKFRAIPAHAPDPTWAEKLAETLAKPTPPPHAKSRPELIAMWKIAPVTFDRLSAKMVSEGKWQKAMLGRVMCYWPV